MSTAQKVLQALNLLPKESGQYRCNSPFRSGSDSNAFSLIIDDDEHGAWQDFASNQKGTLYQLADFLGIDTAKEITTSKRAYRDHHDYATQKGVEWSVFEKAGWTTTKKNRRPAMAISTDNGTRYRFLDYQDSHTYISETGFKSCWYKLREAVQMARANNLPLVYTNGEASVVVAQHYGIPAVTMAGGGERVIPASLLDELQGWWSSGQIIIALDCDNTGRNATNDLLAQFKSAQMNAYGIDMRLGKGGDLADYCNLYQTTTMQELAALPAMTGPLNKTEYVVKRDIISARDLDAKRFQALQMIIEEFGPEGCILFAGKPKARKSWLSTGMCLQVAYGRSALGKYATKQGSVLYMDLESNQRRMQSRLRQMQMNDEPLPENLFIVNEWSKGEEAVKELDEWLTHKQDCVLVVIDILENIRAPRQKNANPYTEDYDAVKPLNVLAEKHHCLILVIHHTRKSKAEDAFDEISGTTGLVGGVSGMWILSRISGDDDKSQQAEFLVRGRDIDADDKRTLKWNDETSMHEVIGDTESFLLSPERRDILKLLENGLHYRPQDIADAIGKSRQNTHKMLTRLKAAGMVKQDSVGKYFCVKNKTIPVGYDDAPPSIDAVPAVAPITPPQEPLPATSMLTMLPEHKLAQMRVLAKSDAQEDHYALAKILNAIGIIGDMQKRVVGELCN
jgi:hypothetical protein